MTSDGLLLATVTALGAQPIDSDQQACRFQHDGREIQLNVQESPAGAHVIGRMRLETVLPDQDPQRILLSLYLDVNLHEAVGFPLWLGLDPVDHALSLFFGTALSTLEPEGLAAMIAEVSALAARDDLLRSVDSAGRGARAGA